MFQIKIIETGELQWVEDVEPYGDTIEVLAEAPDGADTGLLVWDGSQLGEKLSEARARKWAHIKRVREEKRNAGVTTAEGVVDTDAESLNRISFALAMVSSTGGPTSYKWTMADNTVKQLTATKMRQLALAVGAFNMRVQEVSQDLRAQLEAATSIDQIMAIDVEGAAWPS